VPCSSGSAQLIVGNIARVELRESIGRIDGGTPQCTPLLEIERPKRLQRRRIREVRTSQKPGGGLFQSLNVRIGTSRRIAE
jgi:hypothetical protein